MQNDKMIQRLEAMKKRLIEIDDLLCQDDIVTNISKMTELNKERANLEEPVEKYNEYCNILQDIEDSKLMEQDEDPEIVQFAKENITITTSYIALDDELMNALIVNAKSGVKVKLIFCGEKQKKKIKYLARSYFYDLLKDGIEVACITTQVLQKCEREALFLIVNITFLTLYDRL